MRATRPSAPRAHPPLRPGPGPRAAPVGCGAAPGVACGCGATAWCWVAQACVHAAPQKQRRAEEYTHTRSTTSDPAAPSAAPTRACPDVVAARRRAAQEAQGQRGYQGAREAAVRAHRPAAGPDALVGVGWISPMRCSGAWHAPKIAVAPRSRVTRPRTGASRPDPCAELASHLLPHDHPPGEAERRAVRAAPGTAPCQRRGTRRAAGSGPLTSPPAPGRARTRGVWPVPSVRPPRRVSGLVPSALRTATGTRSTV
jgi:hypothetical protein